MSTFFSEVEESASLASETIYERIANGMRNFEKKINITGYGYNTNNLKAFEDVYGFIIRSNYDLY